MGDASGQHTLQGGSGHARGGRRCKYSQRLKQKQRVTASKIALKLRQACPAGWKSACRGTRLCLGKGEV